MKKLICGNWKANCTIENFNKFNEKEFEITNHIECLVAVPHVYIQKASEVLQKNILVCSQDISMFDQGPFTGEVNARMLKDFSIKYSILGHSERRIHLKEKNENINMKIKKAINNEIRPILCIGENKDQRERKDYLEFLLNQFSECVIGLRGESIDIAYEPIWAIGTEKTASKEEISEIIEHLSEWMQNYGIKGRILYGGSITSESIGEIKDIKKLEGFLIGGASLTEDFWKIIEQVSK